MKKYQELFRKIPLFRGITDQERETMLDCLRAREQRFSADSVILLAGQVADCVGIVLEGQAQVIREEFSGNRTILTALGPGDLFAEAFACASGCLLYTSRCVYETAAKELSILFNILLEKCITCFNRSGSAV